MRPGHAAGGAVGWGTALQTGRSRVRFPMASLEFFIDIILPAGVDTGSNRNEYQEYFLGGKSRPVRRADNLTTFMYQLSWNLWASTSWNPQGLSRPVQGLLFSLYVFDDCGEYLNYERCRQLQYENVYPKGQDNPDNRRPVKWRSTVTKT